MDPQNHPSFHTESEPSLTLALTKEHGTAGNGAPAHRISAVLGGVLGDGLHEFVVTAIVQRQDQVQPVAAAVLMMRKC